MYVVLYCLLAYLLLMTLLGFCLMAIDKSRSKREGTRRIPEAALLTLAVLGASFGEILGMNICRHKTKHPQFFIGLPVILLAQLILALLIVQLRSQGGI